MVWFPAFWFHWLTHHALSRLYGAPKNAFRSFVVSNAATASFSLSVLPTRYSNLLHCRRAGAFPSSSTVTLAATTFASVAPTPLYHGDCTHSVRAAFCFMSTCWLTAGRFGPGRETHVNLSTFRHTWKHVRTSRSRVPFTSLSSNACVALSTTNSLHGGLTRCSFPSPFHASSSHGYTVIYPCR
jgi:hypothetical protein